MTTSFAILVSGAIAAVVIPGGRRFEDAIHRVANRWLLDRERKERTLVLNNTGVELHDTLRGRQRWSLP